MCPQGKKRVDAFLSEHTTHSSIWKHNIIPYNQSYEFIYKLSQHFFFCIGTSHKNLYYQSLLILIQNELRFKIREVCKQNRLYSRYWKIEMNTSKPEIKRIKVWRKSSDTTPTPSPQHTPWKVKHVLVSLPAPKEVHLWLVSKMGLSIH